MRTEDEIEEEILSEGADEGFTIETKKERVQEINLEIKRLLGERGEFLNLKNILNYGTKVYC